jgi:hypothetical protein
MGLDDPVGFLASSSLPKEIVDRIAGANAEQLLDTRVRA